MIFAAVTSFDASLALRLAFASLGGLLVFAGLWMEHRNPDAIFSNMAAMRRFEWRSQWGWRVLMLGIAVETAVAGWSALDEWKNNPLNRPISDISAVAIIELKGSGIKEVIPNEQPPWDAWFLLRDSYTNSTDFNAVMLISDGFSKIFAFTAERGNNTQYSLRFHMEDLGMNPSKKMAKAIKNIKSLSLNILFLPTNSEVTWGRVTLLVNSQVQQTFEIPHQENLHSMFPGMSGIMVFATNAPADKVIPHMEK
jgi:hypothetical protein